MKCLTSPQSRCGCMPEVDGPRSHSDYTWSALLNQVNTEEQKNSIVYKSFNKTHLGFVPSSSNLFLPFRSLSFSLHWEAMEVKICLQFSFQGNLEHVIVGAADVADKLLPVLANHVPPILLTEKRCQAFPKVLMINNNCVFCQKNLCEQMSIMWL